MHVNKVSRVFTVNRVAKLLGKPEEVLEAMADTMDTEDGCLWVVGVGEHDILAFTHDGIENLRELLDDAKE